MPLDLKSVDDDGAFAGYASLFGREDLSRDVVLRGAFTETLEKRGAHGVRMLFQHDPSQPIGVWHEIKQDSKGLLARGRLMKDVEKAREVLSLMRAGALDGLSIGFKAVKARRDPRSGIRWLEKIDLWEISVVTFPMLPDARVSGFKPMPFAGEVPTEREFERWLTRDAGLTRSQARALMREGMKGLQALRDAGGGLGANVNLATRIREATSRLQRSVR
ncbi:MAG: HK97 family phage prohead protease [Hyphomicrobiaceae bacterium]|nr:HK97 family phage prohead protease [Hyphomicrobiaceae bacterium]MCC0010273.1 HK97 family phage prohead protease [Hyphomicrobiaceae bacterium]